MENIQYSEPRFHRSTAHIVSESTAVKLYEAGYPQPEVMNLITQYSGGNKYSVKIPGQWIYRPSATEIMEQDAANIIFLHRPEYYGIMEDEEGLPTAGIGEVIIAKHRNGRTGSARCAWNPIRGYTDIEAAPFSPVAPGFDVVDFTEKRPGLGEDIPF